MNAPIGRLTKNAANFINTLIPKSFSFFDLCQINKPAPIIIMISVPTKGIVRMCSIFFVSVFFIYKEINSLTDPITHIEIQSACIVFLQIGEYLKKKIIFFIIVILLWRTWYVYIIAYLYIKVKYTKTPLNKGFLRDEEKE